ncbi:MAG: TolC family protein [Candidatus Latescibacterota bacterium]|jgi:outer membrane protein TolC
MRLSYFWIFLSIGLVETSAENIAFNLNYCLDTAMQNNRELLQARAAIHQVEGDRVIVRSRFLPHLSLTANYDAERDARSGGRSNDQLASSLRFSQRLFEYGPDFAEEVQVRESLRQAVYGYEGQVYEVLSNVWETYHIILLQNRQIAIRRESRENFQTTYERQRARFERHLATESDVLNAQLNVLNEDLALNNLVREQFNKKMTLLRLTGQPIGIEVKLEREESVQFSIEQNRAVELAISNSITIALAAARLNEQRRVLREVEWQYGPDLSLSTGVEDGRRNARLALDKKGQTWGVDISSEYALSEGDPPELRDQGRWSTQIEARIPIFEGSLRTGRQAREKAALRQREIALRNLNTSVELDVRQSYQSMLEAQERQRIQEERVRIARRRLEINQILKEKGQADETLLENFRTQFFNEQDRLFQDQATYIRRIAQLRRQIGHFE